MKIEKLKGRLQSLDDPRRTNCGNYRHKLEDIVIIGLCSTTCGGEDFVDMEDFGKEREDFLRIDCQPKCNKFHQNFIKSSAGVRKFKRFLGRLLMISTTACNCSSEISSNEVPFGKN